MRTPSRLPLFVLAALVAASGCAGSDDSAADAETAPPATTAPPDTLPVPGDPAAPWATEVVEAWEAVLAANETAIVAYLEDFEGYTPDEVAAYRDLLSHPAVADSLDAFPDAPVEVELAELYEGLSIALQDELAAGADAADQIDAKLDEYQSAAESGGHADIDEIRGSMVRARDETTRRCLDLSAALAERDLPTLDCIEGPGPDEGAAPAAETAEPPAFAGEAVTIIISSEPSSDVPGGTFTVAAGAEALGCSAGTWLDVELNEDGTELTSDYTCTDGGRIGTMAVQQHYGAVEWWEFVGGDGDYEGLSGGGITADLDIGEGVTTVTITGHAMYER